MFDATTGSTFLSRDVFMLKYAVMILNILPGVLFAQNPPVDPACIPAINIKESENNICMGAAVTFYATVANGGINAVYKWKKNNLNTVISSAASFSSIDIHEGDVVICEYSCKTACSVDTMVISNSITLHVLNDIIPTISVANNDPLICEGETTVFTATAYYGNAEPFYQWLVNDSLAGTNSPFFSTSTITNGAKVECVLTISTYSCPGSSRSTASQMTIYVYPLIHPAITITPSKTRICRGEEVTFTAIANGGAYPAFAWEINGKPTGADAPALVTSTLKEGDIITCTVTIDQDSRCHTSTSAGSNKIVMHVQDFLDPALKIASPKQDVCEGMVITFTATPQNAGDYKFYQWQVNDHNIDNNSNTFISDQFANGDKVSCTLSTNIVGCPLTVNTKANSELVTIRRAPVITFSPSEISVISGEPAQLFATVSSNIVSAVWTPGDLLLIPHSLISSTIPLTRDTIFKLTVTDTNGCTTSNELVVKVLHKLYMPSSFTPNNDGTNDVFRIPPGASIDLREFSVFDRWGNVIFKTTDMVKGWDGTYHGENLDMGAYVYFIKGIIRDKEVVIKGTVILQR